MLHYAFCGLGYLIMDFNQLIDRGLYSKAIALCTRKLREDPGNSSLLCERTRGFLAVHRYDLAIQDAQNALDLEEGYFLLGSGYIGLGENDQALLTLKEGLTHYQNSARLLTLIDSLHTPSVDEDFDNMVRWLKEGGAYCSAVCLQQGPLRGLQARIHLKVSII